MPKWIIRALALLLVLSLVGCGSGSPSQTAPRPSQESPGSQEPVAETAPSPPPVSLSPAEYLHDRLSAWGDARNTGTAIPPEWVALDAENRLVIADARDVSNVADLLDVAARRFQEQRLDRMILRPSYKAANPVIDDYVVISRDAFGRWPEQALPPLHNWPDYVDLHATRKTPPRTGDPAAEADLINHWVTLVLGRRVTELKQSAQGARDLLVTVDAAGKPERDRLREIGKLGSLLFSTTATERLTVRYTGVDTAKQVEVSRGALMEWATHNGDINFLGRFFVVDGAAPQMVPSPEPPFQKQRALADVLADRPRLERHLPAGAKLYLGLMNADRFNLAVIEATLPGSTTFEQAWEQYATVVEKLFVEGRGLFYVDLILQQGSTVEYMRFDLSTWALRHHVVVKEEMRLDPIYLPLSASIYTRYEPIR